MVANVSELSSMAGLTDGTPAGEGESADGFLQELLGIAGMLPQINLPTTPVAPVSSTAPNTSTLSAAPAAGISDTASDAVMNVNAAQRELPAWLSASLGDLPAMPTDSIATPAVTAGSAAIPQNFVAPTIESAGVDVPVAVATTPSNQAVPDAVPQPLPHQPNAAQTSASTTSPAQASAAQLDIRMPSTQPSTQQSNQVFIDTPTAEVTTAVASTDTDSSVTSNATAPARASAYDIGQMLASMSRFEREPARTPKAATQIATVEAPQGSSVAQGNALLANEPARVAPVVDLLTEAEFSFEDADFTAVDTATPTPGGRDINTVTGAPAQTATSSSDELASSRTLHARVGSPEWKDQLGAQLNWMVENGKHSASLKLTPEHLGPVEVRIDLNQNQTSIWFSATNADTRTALEQSLPRLRELMSEQGMSLNDAGVFREPPREQQRGWTGGAALSSEFQDTNDAPVANARRPAGLLDTYA